MGTVKYTGPVASFHCPTNAEIRSLKVHFSPKQEGTGDPSPENVREIVGWDGVEVYQTDKNFVPSLDDDGFWSIKGYFEADGAIRQNSSYRTFDYISANPNTRYVLSNDVSCWMGIGFYDASKSPINFIQSGSKTSIELTAPSNTAYVRCYVQYIAGRTPQLEIATTATSYEPYQGSTTNYEFGVLGKNKLNIGTVSFTGYKKYEIEGGLMPATYTASALITSDDEDATKSLMLFQNETGTIKQIFFERNTRNAITFTLTQPATTVYIYSADSYQRSVGDATTWSDVQLELGSTATTYEPYDPKHTVYGGWVDLITGEVASTYIHCKIKDLPGEWNYRSGNNRFQITLTDDYANAASSGGIWTHFATSEVYKTSTSNGYGNKQIATYIDKHIYIRDDDFEGDVEEFLSGVGNTYITYELAESTTYSLSPTSMQTFLGQNNIWSNADYVEVEYDLHETQDILARKQFIIANQPHVEKPAAAPLQSFTTDMAAPLKECKVKFEPIQDLHGYDRPWVGGAGKNLFNINATEQNPSDTTLSNTTKRIFTPNTYSVGASYSNWWQPNQVLDYSVNSTGITVKNNNVYGIGFALKLTPETTYFLSATTDTNGNISAAYYDSEGTYLSYQGSRKNSTITIPTNTDITLLIFFTNVNGTDGGTTFTNIQIEEGSTATSYEPYENICPISGWTGLEVTRCGKNFSTAVTGTEMVQKWPVNSNASRELLLTGMQPGQEFTLSASFTKASEPRSNKRLYLNGSQKANSTTNAIFKGPSADGPRDAVIHNWVDTDGTIKITHNNRGLTYNDDFIEYAASLQNIQLEVGDTATAFEPYNGTTIPISFPLVTNILNSVAITVNKTLSAAGEETSETGMSLTNYIKINEGDTYKLTFTSKEGARTRRIYGYDANKEPIESLASASWVSVDSIGTLTATIPSGVEYIRVCYKTADENIFLEGPESSVIYGGYVDLIKGELVQEWAKTLIKDCSWRISWSCFVTIIPNCITFANSMPSTPVLMSKYTPNKNRSNGNGVCSAGAMASIEQLSYGLRNGEKDIGIQDDRFETTETFISQMGDTEIVYKLAEPIHYFLTPQTLKTLRGINNIWSNAGDIELSYWKH